jgi:hypothetical protein
MRFKNVSAIICEYLSNQNVRQRLIRLKLKDNLHSIRYPIMGPSEKSDWSLPANQH